MYAKVMRISNAHFYTSTVGGIYGSSSQQDWVLKRASTVSFKFSLNSNRCIGYYGRIYMLSMAKLQLTYLRLPKTIIVPLRILTGFFYVLLISPLESHLTEKICRIYTITLTSTLKFSKFLFKSKYVKLCPRSDITQKLVEDCVERLEKIKNYKKNKKYIGLTRDFLTDPNFLVLAYLRIKNNLGNMTGVVDKVTLDGIDKNWFINAARKINKNTYKFKPAKIIEIFKPNGEGLRPLTIGSPRDKIIQKAISLIINQIYEYNDKTFLDVSHGFRPKRSSHTALREIKTKWTGLYWYVKADIEKAFDTIQRNVLINILNKKIKDQRLTDLIRKMFKCRILAPDGFYFKNNRGVPQGNVLSPLLFNVYLHELDVFMTNLAKKYYKGKFPALNPEYHKKLELSKYERTLANEIQDSIKRSRRRQLFNKGIKPYLHDGNYIRMRYLRYADAILIGIRGPKLVAEKIKMEMANWLSMALHLNLNEKKTHLSYIIGNKIEFLGFYLYNIPYNQMPFRNSRRIEKFKRIKSRLLAYKEATKKKLSKRIRIDLIKIIKEKLKIKNKKSTEKVIHELSDVLVNILGDEVDAKSSYREILRKLELNLIEVIINDTNENIKKTLELLTDPKLLDSPEINENPGGYSTQRDTTLISKAKLSEAEFARRFTKLLEMNGYEYYKKKDPNKIRFDKNMVKYLRENNINLTYYPMKVILSEKIKNQLVKHSKSSPVRGALASNYKILINYFWEEQNKVDLKRRVTKEQSENLIGRLKVLESRSGVLVNLPIKLKVNWDVIDERLKNRGFLNKKGRPASVARLTTLGLSDLIKHFLHVLCSYLSYYRCADNFNQAKNRFYWYFKYSLVSTIKAKQKLGSRAKVFCKYGSDISCLDNKGREISFLKSEDIKRLKKSFLINTQFEDLNKILNTTWIKT